MRYRFTLLSQNAIIQNIKKVINNRERYKEKGTHTWLMKMKSSMATMENSVENPQKPKNRANI